MNLSRRMAGICFAIGAAATGCGGAKPAVAISSSCDSAMRHLAVVADAEDSVLGPAQTASVRDCGSVAEWEAAARKYNGPHKDIYATGNPLEALAAYCDGEMQTATCREMQAKHEDLIDKSNGK